MARYAVWPGQKPEDSDRQIEEQEEDVKPTRAAPKRRKVDGGKTAAAEIDEDDKKDIDIKKVDDEGADYVQTVSSSRKRAARR